MTATCAHLISRSITKNKKQYQTLPAESPTWKKTDKIHQIKQMIFESGNMYQKRDLGFAEKKD
jgi:hypothetical protein